MEAHKDVEAALNRIKPKRIKKDLIEESAIDEMISLMRQKMKAAAETDHELNKLKQPAIAKLKMLPSVDEQLTKATLFEQFLDNNILEGIKAWLEPHLGDGSLPNLDIQRSMIRALMEMPIRTEHLRESGIGRVIMFYSKCDDIVPDLKRNVKDILGEFIRCTLGLTDSPDKWMRPILNRSDNYKDRIVKEVDYDSIRRWVAVFQSSPSDTVY